jgi:hypothetical protein
MQGVASSLTPAVSRTLAKQGLVRPLLQVGLHPVSNSRLCNAVNVRCAQ